MRATSTPIALEVAVASTVKQSSIDPTELEHAKALAHTRWRHQPQTALVGERDWVTIVPTQRTAPGLVPF
jgi:hypothetical protein